MPFTNLIAFGTIQLIRTSRIESDNRLRRHKRTTDTKTQLNPATTQLKRHPIILPMHPFVRNTPSSMSCDCHTFALFHYDGCQSSNANRHSARNLKQSNSPPSALQLNSTETRHPDCDGGGAMGLARKSSNPAIDRSSVYITIEEESRNSLRYI